MFQLGKLLCVHFFLWMVLTIHTVWWFRYPASHLISIYMYIPGTQMTLVLLGKGIVLEGWPSKIEVGWVPIICLYIEKLFKKSWHFKLLLIKMVNAFLDHQQYQVVGFGCFVEVKVSGQPEVKVCVGYLICSSLPWRGNHGKGPRVWKNLEKIQGNSPVGYPDFFFTQIPFLKLTVRTWKWAGHQKESKDRIPTIHFQVRAVSFRGCRSKAKSIIYIISQALKEKPEVCLVNCLKFSVLHEQWKRAPGCLGYIVDEMYEMPPSFMGSLLHNQEAMECHSSFFFMAHMSKHPRKWMGWHPMLTPTSLTAKKRDEGNLEMMFGFCFNFGGVVFNQTHWYILIYFFFATRVNIYITYLWGVWYSYVSNFGAITLPLFFSWFQSN